MKKIYNHNNNNNNKKSCISRKMKILFFEKFRKILKFIYLQVNNISLVLEIDQSKRVK